VGPYPELIPPTVPEVRRIIRAMSGPEAQREFRLGWSLFRRAHQAVAKRCHEATHREKHAPTSIMPPSMSLVVVEEVSPTHSPSPLKLAHRRPPLTHRSALFWPTNSGSVLESYCRGKSRARDVRGVMTDKCSVRYCGSWTRALRGGTYQRKSLGPIARSTVGTASGAKKGFGLG
jgi:hypothetical protein